MSSAALNVGSSYQTVSQGVRKMLTDHRCRRGGPVAAPFAIQMVRAAPAVLVIDCLKQRPDGPMPAVRRVVLCDCSSGVRSGLPRWGQCEGRPVRTSRASALALAHRLLVALAGPPQALDAPEDARYGKEPSSVGTTCRTSPSGRKDRSDPSPGRPQPLSDGRPYVAS